MATNKPKKATEKNTIRDDILRCEQQIFGIMVKGSKATKQRLYKYIIQYSRSMWIMYTINMLFCSLFAVENIETQE